MDLKTQTVLIKRQSVFYNRNFMLLFSGKVISQIWDQIFSFSLSWYVLELTQSSLQMAAFLVINCLCGTFISPFGGIIADRFNRKAILVLMDVIRGIVVIVSAFLLYYHILEIWMLYISAFILASCGAIFSPAASSIIPNVVDENQLVQASSMDQFVWSFCCMIGLFISGILFNWIGIFAIFALNAASYFISGILEYCVKIPFQNKDKIDQKFLFKQEFIKAIQEIRTGFRYFNDNRILFIMVMMLASLNFIAFPLANVFFPYLFNVILKAEPFQLAITQSASWIGMIVSSFLVPLFFNRFKFKNSIFLGFLTYSLCVLAVTPLLFPPLMGRVNNWGITIILSVAGFIIGLALFFLIVQANVFCQKFTSDEYRGRFWGLQASIVSLAMAVGYFFGGFLTQKVMMGILFVGNSIFALIISLCIVNSKEIKQLNE